MTTPTTEMRFATATTVSDGELVLATSGGRAPHPYFFSGVIHEAPFVTRALLALGKVARTRYFDAAAASRSRDPVATSTIHTLRFEAFSACNGVYARLDVDAQSFEADHLDWGPTNVDFNEPMELALTAMGEDSTMVLAVGRDELMVASGTASAVEKKVPLPSRWLRGFGESQAIAATMQPVAHWPGSVVRRVLGDLVRADAHARTPWVNFDGDRVRRSSLPSESAVCLLGPHRLATLLALSKFATGLTCYRPSLAARAGVAGNEPRNVALHATAWVLECGSSRFTVVLSPEPYRGFSGEGAFLCSLAETPEEHVAMVSAILEGQDALDADTVAAEVGLTAQEVGAAFLVLGAAGRLGFDLTSGSYFHRDLPYDRTAISQVQPRLKDAWELVGKGAVAAAGSGSWTVRGQASEYTVRLGEDERCGCEWFLRHRGERGPCKHILAASITASAAVRASDVMR